MNHKPILATLILLVMFSTPLISANPAEKSPFECTIWDDLLDIFRTDNCGSQFIGIVKQDLGKEFILQKNKPELKDKNNDGLSDVKTTITKFDDYTLQVDVTQTNDAKGQSAYKWASAVCGYKNITTVGKQEYNPSTKVWTNTGSLTYGKLINYGLPSSWCSETNGNGFVLFGSGSGNKTYRLIFPNKDYKEFKIMTGEATNEDLLTYQETSTLTYLDIVNDLEINNTLKKFNGLDYIIAPNDLFINQEGENIKFGAYDYIATSDTNYLYDITSNKQITHFKENTFIFDTFSLNNKAHYRIINFDDVCTYQSCNFEINDTNLKIYFIGEYNSTLGGINIDPLITSVEVPLISSYVYTNTTYEATPYAHLEINDSAYRFANFDGTDDYLIVPNSDSSDNYLNSSEPFTLMGWVKPDEFGNNMALIGRWSTTTTNRNFILGRGNNNRYWFRASADGSGTGLLTLESTLQTTSDWTHIAGVFNGTDMFLYRDGTLSATATYTPHSSSIADIWIGEINSGAFDWTGALDEIMIFNNSLNQTQVQDIMNLNRTLYTGDTTNLVSYWNFNGGADNYLDTTGNRNLTKVESTTTIPDIAFDSLNAQSSYIQSYYSFDADNYTRSWEAGQVNNSLYFDGTDTVSISNSLTSDNFTYVTWVKREEFTTNFNGIMSEGSRSLYYLTSVGTPSIFSYYMGGSTGHLNANTALTIGQWQHIAVVYAQNESIKFYLDGNLDKEIACSSCGIPSSATSFTIGQYPGQNRMRGNLDEIKIFNRTLSLEEIQNIYTNESLGMNDPNLDTTELKAEYKLNESSGFSAFDSTGNGNTGSLTGYTFTVRDLTNNNNDVTTANEAYLGQGLYGNTLFLDGTNDYIPLSTSLASLTSNFSVSAWVKSTGGSAEMTIVSRGNAPASGSHNWGLDTYYGGIVANRNAPRFTIRTSSNVYTVGGDSTPFKLDDDQWHLVTGVYDSSANTISLYLDGTYYAQTATAGTLLAGQTANIGRNNQGFYFNGSIDEVMIFNKALNSTEISDIYNNLSNRFLPEGTIQTAPTPLNASVNYIEIVTDAQTNFGTSLQAKIDYWNVDYGYNVSQSLTDGLVTYYQADGNANDYMGINNGTLNGDANANQVGVYSSAFGFDGNGDFVEISDKNGFNGSVGTISMWVKVADLLKRNYFSYRGGSPNQIRALSTTFIIYDSVSGDRQVTIGTPTLNEWTLLTFTWDNGNLFSYMNGQIVDDTTSGAGTGIFDFALSEPLYLGRYASSYFNGSIDEVMIYNRSLSAEEVKQLYLYGLANWNTTDWVNVTDNVATIPLNNYFDTASTIRTDLKLLDGTNQGFYTPYVFDFTIDGYNATPEISFIPITSNGTQAEGQLEIYYNLSLNFSDDADVSLYYSNGTLFETQNVNSPNLNGTFTLTDFGTYYMNATTTTSTTNSTETLEIILVADATFPLIDFISPTPLNDTTAGTNGMLKVYVNTSDLNFYNTTINVYFDNGSLLETYTELLISTPQIVNKNFSIPVSGEYYLFNATACDTYSNCNSTETRRVYIDFLFNTLELFTPIQNNLYNTTYIPLNYYAFDPAGVDRVWYNVVYSSYGLNTTVISNTTITGNTTIPLLLTGSYYLNLFANDTIGNEGNILNRFFHVAEGNFSQYIPVANVTYFCLEPAFGYNYLNNARYVEC